MLAVGIGPIGPFEGLIILAIVILIFGVGKLSDVGGALGKSIREFRRAARAPDEPEQAQSASDAAAPAPDGAQATAAACATGGPQADAPGSDSIPARGGHRVPGDDRIGQVEY